MPIDEEMDDPNADEDLIPKDVRRHRSMLDSRIQADGELSDSDDEGDGGRRDHASYKKRRVRSPSRSPVHGMNMGIMASGPTPGHAGPSGQTTVEKVLAKMDMDVDPPVESNARMESPSVRSPSTDVASSGSESTPGVEAASVMVPDSAPAPSIAASSVDLDIEPGEMVTD